MRVSVSREQEIYKTIEKDCVGAKKYVNGCDLESGCRGREAAKPLSSCSRRPAEWKIRDLSFWLRPCPTLMLPIRLKERKPTRCRGQLARDIQWKPRTLGSSVLKT